MPTTLTGIPLVYIANIRGRLVEYQYRLKLTTTSYATLTEHLKSDVNFIESIVHAIRDKKNNEIQLAKGHENGQGKTLPAG